MIRFRMMRFVYPLLLLTLVLGACSPSLSSSEAVPTLTPTSLPPTLVTPSPTATNTQTPAPFPSLTPTVTIIPTSTSTLTRLDQSIVDMPIATPTPFDVKQCGGMYPDEIYSLSDKIDVAIKTLEPKAEGWAEEIAQGCTNKDGKSHYTAFGIWFHIDIPTTDLKAYKTLGSWIIDVMNLLDTIPRDDSTAGAEPTNAIFTFYANNSESLEVVVPIQEYWTKASGKSAEEVFQIFYKKP